MTRDENSRDKKSFSELDAQRREKKHQREDSSSSQKRLESSQAYSSYKRDLNKIFDGGGLPEALKEKLGETAVGKQAQSRKSDLLALTQANGARKILAALKHYQKAHGFPEDEGGLTRLLDLDDEPEIVIEALQGLESLQDVGALKRLSAVKMRVKSVKMTAEDDDLWSRADDFLKKL
jgi:hypothetical protein